MALPWGDEADCAVTMFVVVPLHQRRDPRARSREVCERPQRVFRAVLQGFEQRRRVSSGIAGLLAWCPPHKCKTAVERRHVGGACQLFSFQYAIGFSQKAQQQPCLRRPKGFLGPIAEDQLEAAFGPEMAKAGQQGTRREPPDPAAADHQAPKGLSRRLDALGLATAQTYRRIIMTGLVGRLRLKRQAANQCRRTDLLAVTRPCRVTGRTPENWECSVPIHQ